MIDVLSKYPLILLFVVASVGYFLGNIKIKGSSLGAAAVLFTGLVFGAIDPKLQIPQIIFLLGLTLFVYSIGLNSGPAFFKSYKANGIRDFIFIFSIIIVTGLIATLLWFIFGFSAATITGAYAGSTTNTPALAGIIDYIGMTYSPEESDSLIQASVVAYSYSYPMGILGGIIAIIIMEKVLKVDYENERKILRRQYPVDEKMTSSTIKIQNQEICNLPLRDLVKHYNWNVSFGRIHSNGNTQLIHWDSIFKIGDLVFIAGSEEDIELVTKDLGIKYHSDIAYDRTKYDVRRIFVSNPKLAGRSIASLNIGEKYNAVISRIRRGDVEMLATGKTILELGDRLRFIALRKDLKDLADYFGDSYTESSKVNLFSFGLGIGLGLLLGSFEFHFGSNFSFKLGYAGGPLIVGLILGALRRTGPILWTLPYGANVTLQQIGLIFLLASIGVTSGNAFVQSFSSEAVLIIIASAIISLLTAFIILFVGYKFIKIPFSFLMGMVSNQPAILDFALSRSKNRIPTFGYAMVFPIALISKIVIAQLLFIFLSS